MILKNIISKIQENSIAIGDIRQTGDAGWPYIVKNILGCEIEIIKLGNQVVTWMPECVGADKLLARKVENPSRLKKLLTS